MNRVKPRKIIIKNIWCNKGIAKFSMYTLLLLFRYNYYGNIDNNVIINPIIENCSNPAGTESLPVPGDSYLKIIKNPDSK